MTDPSARPPRYRLRRNGSRRLAIVRGRHEGTEEQVGFTGEGDRLFGFTHLPQANPIGGLVICSPVHAEFPHNYRKEVLLAREMAASGVVVRRFHYRGTGNSDGQDDTLSFESMLEDALASRDLLRRRTGVDRIAFLGTRLGALVAAAAQSEARGALALWEPVLDPVDYFREIFRVASVRDLKGASVASSRGSRTNRLSIDELKAIGSVDVLGYSVHHNLYRSLEGHELMKELDGRARDVLLVQLGRQATVTPRYQRFTEDLRSAGSTVRVHVIEADEHWWFSGNPDHSIPTLKAVVAVTTEWLTTMLRSR